MRAAVAVIACTLGLVFTPAAFAGVASVEQVDGAPQATFQGGGEQNSLSASRNVDSSGIHWTFNDSQPMSAGGGCHSNSANSVTCDLGGFSESGAVIRLGGGDDSASVFSPVRVVDGQDGNDSLTGTALDGGPGNDTLTGASSVGSVFFTSPGDGIDTIHGGSGASDTIQMSGPGTLDMRSDPDNITGVETIRGSSGADTIISDDRVVQPGGLNPGWRILGSDGNDRLVAGSVGNEMRGGAGDDQLTGGPGPDFLEGDEGNDTLDGGPGVDEYQGDDGQDKLRADDGNAENLHCGADVDRAVPDMLDTVNADCELVGPADTTRTSINCPGDSNHPNTAGDPGVPITCHVLVEDICTSSCAGTTPTGSLTIDFADGTADPSCTLTPTPNPLNSTCDVTVTPNAAGPHEIAADYPGDTDHDPSADRNTFETGCLPAQGQQVRVGNAVALGCFEERKDSQGKGTGVFETSQMAWIGGFEAVPDPGGAKLVVDTGKGEVREDGGGVELRIDGTPIALPVAALPVKLSQADVELGRSGSIEKAVLDLPLDGKLKVSWSSGGTAALLEGEVSVSKVTSAIGLVTTAGSGSGADFKFSAKLSNGKGLELSTAEAKIDEIDVTPKIFKLPRPLALKNLTFNYSRKTDPATGESRPFWSAGGLLSIPFTKNPIDLGGKVFVFNGSLAGGGIAVDGINKPIPDTPLFLQKISGDLVLLPNFGINTTVGATFGPRIAGKQLFTLDGNLTAGALVSPLDCGNGPDPFKIDATLKFVPLEDQQLAKVDLTQRICSYASFASIPGLVGQDVTMQGKLEFLRGAFGYDGSESGFVGNHGANLEGSAVIKLPGTPDPTGRVIVSTIGIAGCGRINGVELGFGYKWGDLTPAPFTSCDFTLYKVPIASAGVNPAAARAIRLRGGLPSVAFAVTGSSGAPRIEVAGPGGLKFSSPAGDGGLRTSRVLVAPSPTESKTYVIVKAPRGGRWQFTSLDPSNRITRVAVANGLPHPRVSAKLRHLGHGRLALRWRVAPIAGQKVDFIERGPATERRLGNAHGRSGTIRYRPYVAASPQRTILAEVIQNGLPRAVTPLVHYRAPAAHRPARPHVTAKRTRNTVALKWRRVRGAARYIVVVKAGATQLAGVFTRSTHLKIPHTPATGALRVTVRATSNITPSGPAAALTLKAP